MTELFWDYEVTYHYEDYDYTQQVRAHGPQGAEHKVLESLVAQYGGEYKQWKHIKTEMIGTGRPIRVGDDCEN